MLFSIPIFVIIFRETLEAGIIISVLLALVQQLVSNKPINPSASPVPTDNSYQTVSGLPETFAAGADDRKPSFERRRPSDAGSIRYAPEEQSLSDQKLLRKLRIQIIAGAGIGLFIALAIGAAFIAVFYTTVKDLFAQFEDIWEGVFAIIACLMIFVMGITMLRMDRAKVKWRLKLQAAFEKDQKVKEASSMTSKDKKAGFRTRYALLLLPLVTVLREALEAVVFVGGVSLGQEGKSIPLAAITGLIAGIIVGILLYKSSSRLNMSIFLVGSTCLLLLIGAGLASKAVGSFETYRYNRMVGGDVSETGSGPGSYSVHGNVWHLNCCNPETNDSGWAVFNAIFGWTNNATIGTILAYIVYWLAVIVALVYMKWEEGRFALFGAKSAAFKRREERRMNSETPPRSSPGIDKVISSEERGGVHVLRN